MDESVKMAVTLSKAGFSEVYCTPHRIRGVFEADNDTVRKGVSELQERLNSLRIDLRLNPGREHYLDKFFPDFPEAPLPLGASGLLLIEVAFHASPELVKESCRRIRAEGSTPLIAHPERTPQFELPATPQNSMRAWFNAQCSKFRSSRHGWSCEPGTMDVDRPMNPLVEYLREIGCQFQGNIGSFAGIYGDQVRRRAVAFLEAGLYSRFGTDAHSPYQLEQWVTEGLSEVRRVTGSGAAGQLQGDRAAPPESDTMKRSSP
jgi:protein-tyrosine phosphatase